MVKKFVAAGALLMALASSAVAQPVSGEDGTTQGHGCEFYSDPGFGGSAMKINGGEGIAFFGQSSIAGMEMTVIQEATRLGVASVASLANCEANVEYTSDGQYVPDGPTETVSYTNNNDLIGSAVMDKEIALYCTCN